MVLQMIEYSLYYLSAMNPVKHLPNFITSLNLLCGCLAILSLTYASDPLTAAFLVIAAAIFDFLDGFVARLLKVTSSIGAELDSLADMVTFGVVPGLMLLHYLAETIGITSMNLQSFSDKPILLIPLLVPIFSALRLAKFNVDSRQSDSFRGLPTPASALWVIAIPLMVEYSPIGMRGDIGPVQKVIVDQWFIVCSSIVLSALMVSDIPLMAMKFKSFGWKDNQVRYAFLIISLVLLIILQPIAIPIILSLYLLISIFKNLFSKRNEV